METTVYDVTYFIKKFEAIPEEDFLIGRRHLGDKHCAHGWCDSTRNNSIEPHEYTPEERSFSQLARKLGVKGFGGINNGTDTNYQQPTPKQRILAALYDIKKAQQPEVKERIVYVMRDQAVKELTTLELIES